MRCLHQSVSQDFIRWVKVLKKLHQTFDLNLKAATQKEADAKAQSQQGLLATYLIPGCVGRRVRLGSESSSGAGGVLGILEVMLILQYGKVN